MRCHCAIAPSFSLHHRFANAHTRHTRARTRTDCDARRTFGAPQLAREPCGARTLCGMSSCIWCGVPIDMSVTIYIYIYIYIYIGVYIYGMIKFSGWLVCLACALKFVGRPQLRMPHTGRLYEYILHILIYMCVCVCFLFLLRLRKAFGCSIL